MSEAGVLGARPGEKGLMLTRPPAALSSAVEGNLLILTIPTTPVILTVRVVHPTTVLMKACPVCAIQFDDAQVKCTTCGESLPVPEYLQAEAPIPPRELTRWLLWLLISVIAAIIVGYSWHKRSQSRISPQEVLRKCQESCEAKCKLSIDDPCTTPPSESFNACLSACVTTHALAPDSAF